MDNKNKNYKIALYIRVSTEEQAENPEGSIKNQEQRLREAVTYRNARSNFGEITGVYVDAGISAKDMNRPKLMEMLSAVKRSEINLVMVTELSRLSRNNRDFLSMWDMMHDQNCRFMSLREDFDTTSAAGEMLLFQLMNFAQFERKQTSERVGANIQARSSRGLYNGGCIPLGYKRIPDKLGYLDVDEDAANTVRASFEAYLKEGCLSHAAKWLNDNSYSIKKHMEGGGRHKRVGHFTVDNLHNILQNKAYVGVKVYTQKGEQKEVRAVWNAIIDEVTFKRVNDKLAKNKSRMKPKSFYKLPYLLSGVNFCMTCGDHLPGKSATGKCGKVGYYEHSWATKRDSTLTKKIFKCDPHRVPAKRLEPAVWQELVRFVTKPEMIKSLMNEVKAKHEGKPGLKESDRLKTKLYGVNSQIDALAERLSQIPKSVSATPIFKQMEKLEAIKNEIMDAITKSNHGHTVPIEKRLIDLETFEAFAKSFRKFIKTMDHDMKKAMVQKFIKKVEVGVDSIKIQWIIDKQHYDQELASADKTKPSEVPSEGSYFFKSKSSHSLTFGARGGT
ncbi:MAG: recombinase family protein [Bdellovibrio sp.]|nr:recombinase family protein [Bdellovibrio sp.]